MYRPPCERGRVCPCDEQMQLMKQPENRLISDDFKQFPLAQFNPSDVGVRLEFGLLSPGVAW